MTTDSGILLSNEKKKSCISIIFHFSIVDFLSDLMQDAGFKVCQLDYIKRDTINKKEGICVPRIFVQGKFLVKNTWQKKAYKIFLLFLLIKWFTPNRSKNCCLNLVFPLFTFTLLENIGYSYWLNLFSPVTKL